jgi:hypothetical protein
LMRLTGRAVYARPDGSRLTIPGFGLCDMVPNIGEAGTGEARTDMNPVCAGV